MIKPEINLILFLSIMHYMTQNMTEVCTVFLKSDSGNNEAFLLNIIESLEQIHVLISYLDDANSLKLLKLLQARFLVFFFTSFCSQAFYIQILDRIRPAKGTYRTDPIH